MLRFTYLFALVLLIGIIQTASTYKIETQYDKFNDVTKVKLNLMPVPLQSAEELWLSAQFTSKGQKVLPPEEVMLAFVWGSKDGKFSQGNELIVLADGERVRVGKMYRDASYSSRHKNPTKEIMALNIPVATFLKIARAKKLEAKMSIHEFALADENLSALRDLAGRMAP
jgi:hypothetical protein